MQIKLSREKDVHILTVSGTIAERDASVLKAGLTKLLKDGKNKIILELLQPQGLTPLILKELATLNALARELSGSILLAGVDALTRAKIESLSTPPVIQCHESRAHALAAMAQPVVAPGAPPASATGTRPVDVLTQEIEELRKQLRAKESGELETLRKNAATATERIQVLEQQLESLILTRRLPPDLAAHLERMKTLEAQNEELLLKIRVLEGG